MSLNIKRTIYYKIYFFNIHVAWNWAKLRKDEGLPILGARALDVVCESALMLRYLNIQYQLLYKLKSAAYFWLFPWYYAFPNN